MIRRKSVNDRSVRQLLEVLRREYVATFPRAQIDAYRYNPAAIWVRIIDPSFAGEDPADRDAKVRPFLWKFLPEAIHADINLLLLLTPKETKQSLMNREFEDQISNHP